jgi:exoribonuclease-2
MVRLGDIDLISLDIHGTVTARLDAEPDAAAREELEDEFDDDTVAGPIAIAMDVSDAATLEGGQPAPVEPATP